MLLCQYGASTLAKFLRRSIVNTMNTEGVAGIPSLPTESMRTGRMLVNGARAASTIPRPRSTPQPQKIWHPNHGIVFQPSPRPGIARMTSVAAVSMERDMALHSNAEDSYVLASSGMSAVDLAIQRDIEGGKEVPKPFQIPDPVEVPYDPRWDALPDQTGQTWKMPEELFRAAKDAEPGTPESYWSHSLYRGPPDEGKPDGKTVTVHYCKSKHTTERILATHFADSKVIGFDIEWLANASKSAGPKQKVSLVQIANEERVALFHIALFAGNTKEDLVPPTLKKLMEDPEVTKVGVAIKGDCTRIRNNLDIDAKGLFELSHLFKLIKFSESNEHQLINKKLVSLATQVQEHLHLPLFKGGDVRSSDWSRILEIKQIRYAASDSYAGFQLFNMMEAKREKLDPTPPRPYHAECNIPIRIATGETLATDDPEEAEESKPEEPDTPLPPKRKSTKKTLTYYDESGDFDFKDVEPETTFQAEVFVPVPVRRRAPRSKVTALKEGNQEDSTPLPAEELESQDDSPNATLLQTDLETPDDTNATLLQSAESEALSHITTSTSTSSTSTPNLSTLRTYFLWSQNPSLSLEDIASIERDPPLSIQSVVRRILEVASWRTETSGQEVVDGDIDKKQRIRVVLGRWRDMGFETSVWGSLESRLNGEGGVEGEK
ncbi:Ribonuclease H-like protein [Glarea lozoyensis ATCC 20868]|uniref:Ribonuclease H-like protein n=1 Tax=Glarea lozoyensis (strain ATCC 20868 / MF5171) TaxID=1116229 RepID=S3E1J0_GLAL2|nr:Ribonuclease H-like protein [Glarea lozoyensis ATCC 20868]EPE32338.1 Ribonuclease H-like protein [Glarea lozoyensis ATCC 20868]